MTRGRMIATIQIAKTISMLPYMDVQNQSHDFSVILLIKFT